MGTSAPIGRFCSLLHHGGTTGAQMTLGQKILVAFECVTGTLLTVVAVVMIVEIFSVNRAIWPAVLSLM